MSAYNQSDVVKFDERWAEYNECSYELLRELLRELPLDLTTILDMGCGTGNTLIELQTQYPQAKLMGVDSNMHMVKASQNKVPKATIIHSDTMPTLSVDLVTCVSVLHHLPSVTQWVEQLEQVNSLYCICIDWDKTFLPMRLRAPLLQLRSDVFQILTLKQAELILPNSWSRVKTVQGECQSGWWQLWGVLWKRNLSAKPVTP